MYLDIAGRWVNKRNDLTIASSKHDTQEDAIKAAAPVALTSSALFGARNPVGYPHHDQLVHPVTVHVHDLEPQSIPLESVRNLRYAPELRHDEPAERVITARALLGQRVLDPDDVLEPIDRHATVDQP